MVGHLAQRQHYGPSNSSCDGRKEAQIGVNGLQSAAVVVEAAATQRQSLKLQLKYARCCCNVLVSPRMGNLSVVVGGSFLVRTREHTLRCVISNWLLSYLHTCTHTYMQRRGAFRFVQLHGFACVTCRLEIDNAVDIDGKSMWTFSCDKQFSKRVLVLGAMW